MNVHTIEKLDAAVASSKGLVHVPTHFNANKLVEVLQQLMPVPASIKAAASKEQPLRASGHKFTVKEIDDAMAGRVIGISDRFRLKAAMTQNGIL